MMSNDELQHKGFFCEQAPEGHKINPRENITTVDAGNGNKRHFHQEVIFMY